MRTLLLGVVAGVVAAIVIRSLVLGRASQGRVDVFARRCDVTVTDADHASVSAYLGEARRWRWAGLAAVFVFLAVTDRSYLTIANYYAYSWLIKALPFLAAGWLVGTIIADVRFVRRQSPRPIATVPVYRLLLPVLAVGYVTGAVLLRAYADATFNSHQELWWGLAAAVTAGMAGGAVSYLRRHATGIFDGLDVAIREHSIARIAGLGVAVASVLFIDALYAAEWSTDGAAIAALPTVLRLLLLAAVTSGAIMTFGSAGQPPPGVRRDRVASALIVVAVVAALASGALVGQRMWQDRSPFPPSALHASVTVRFTDEAHFSSDVAAVGAPAGIANWPGDGGARMFVGRIDYSMPAGTHPRGEFLAVFIDNRTSTVIAQLSGVDGSAWGGFDTAELPKRYPWLAALGPHRDATGGYSDNGNAVTFDAADPGPQAFSGSVADGATFTVGNFVVALIFVGPDSQIYWAAQLPVHL